MKEPMDLPLPPFFYRWQVKLKQKKRLRPGDTSQEREEKRSRSHESDLIRTQTPQETPQRICENVPCLPEPTLHPLTSRGEHRVSENVSTSEDPRLRFNMKVCPRMPPSSGQTSELCNNDNSLNITNTAPTDPLDRVDIQQIDTSQLAKNGTVQEMPSKKTCSFANVIHDTHLKNENCEDSKTTKGTRIKPPIENDFKVSSIPSPQGTSSKYPKGQPKDKETSEKIVSASSPQSYHNTLPMKEMKASNINKNSTLLQSDIPPIQNLATHLKPRDIPAEITNQEKGNGFKYSAENQPSISHGKNYSANTGGDEISSSIKVNPKAEKNNEFSGSASLKNKVVIKNRSLSPEKFPMSHLEMRQFRMEQTKKDIARQAAKRAQALENRKTKNIPFSNASSEYSDLMLASNRFGNNPFLKSRSNSSRSSTASPVCDDSLLKEHNYIRGGKRKEVLESININHHDVDQPSNEQCFKENEHVNSGELKGSSSDHSIEDVTFETAKGKETIPVQELSYRNGVLLTERERVKATNHPLQLSLQEKPTSADIVLPDNSLKIKPLQSTTTTQPVRNENLVSNEQQVKSIPLVMNTNENSGVARIISDQACSTLGECALQSDNENNPNYDGKSQSGKRKCEFPHDETVPKKVILCHEISIPVTLNTLTLVSSSNKGRDAPNEASNSLDSRTLSKQIFSDTKEISTSSPKANKHSNVQHEQVTDFARLFSHGQTNNSLKEEIESPVDNVQYKSSNDDRNVLLCDQTTLLATQPKTNVCDNLNLLNKAMLIETEESSPSRTETEVSDCNVVSKLLSSVEMPPSSSGSPSVDFVEVATEIPRDDIQCETFDDDRNSTVDAQAVCFSTSETGNSTNTCSQIKPLSRVILIDEKITSRLCPEVKNSSDNITGPHGDDQNLTLNNEVSCVQCSDTIGHVDSQHEEQPSEEKLLMVKQLSSFDAEHVSQSKNQCKSTNKEHLSSIDQTTSSDSAKTKAFVNSDAELKVTDSDVQMDSNRTCHVRSETENLLQPNDQDDSVADSEMAHCGTIKTDITKIKLETEMLDNGNLSVISKEMSMTIDESPSTEIAPASPFALKDNDADHPIICSILATKDGNSIPVVDAFPPNLLAVSVFTDRVGILQEINRTNNDHSISESHLDCNIKGRDNAANTIDTSAVPIRNKDPSDNKPENTFSSENVMQRIVSSDIPSSANKNQTNFPSGIEYRYPCVSSMAENLVKSHPEVEVKIENCETETCDTETCDEVAVEIDDVGYSADLNDGMLYQLQGVAYQPDLEDVTLTDIKAEGEEADNEVYLNLNKNNIQRGFKITNIFSLIDSNKNEESLNLGGGHMDFDQNESSIIPVIDYIRPENETTTPNSEVSPSLNNDARAVENKSNLEQSSVDENVLRLVDEIKACFSDWASPPCLHNAISQRSPIPTNIQPEILDKEENVNEIQKPSISNIVESKSLNTDLSSVESGKDLELHQSSVDENAQKIADESVLSLENVKSQRSPIHTNIEPDILHKEEVDQTDPIVLTDMKLTSECSTLPSTDPNKAHTQVMSEVPNREVSDQNKDEQVMQTGELQTEKEGNLGYSSSRKSTTLSIIGPESFNTDVITDESRNDLQEPSADENAERVTDRDSPSCLQNVKSQRSVIPTRRVEPELPDKEIDVNQINPNALADIKLPSEGSLLLSTDSNNQSLILNNVLCQESSDQNKHAGELQTNNEENLCDSIEARLKDPAVVVEEENIPLYCEAFDTWISAFEWLSSSFQSNDESGSISGTEPNQAFPSTHHAQGESFHPESAARLPNISLNSNGTSLKSENVPEYILTDLQFPLLPEGRDDNADYSEATFGHPGGDSHASFASLFHVSTGLEFTTDSNLSLNASGDQVGSFNACTNVPPYANFVPSTEPNTNSHQMLEPLVPSIIPQVDQSPQNSSVIFGETTQLNSSSDLPPQLQLEPLAPSSNPQVNQNPQNISAIIGETAELNSRIGLPSQLRLEPVVSPIISQANQNHQSSSVMPQEVMHNLRERLQAPPNNNHYIMNNFYTMLNQHDTGHSKSADPSYHSQFVPSTIPQRPASAAPPSYAQHKTWRPSSGNQSPYRPQCYPYSQQPAPIADPFHMGRNLSPLTNSHSRPFLPCHQCGQPANYRCAGCHQVNYCSPGCSAISWRNGHNIICFQKKN